MKPPGSRDDSIIVVVMSLIYQWMLRRSIELYGDLTSVCIGADMGNTQIDG
jgi:hypothetical protein